MAFDYKSMQDKATALLKEYGKTLKLRNNQPGQYIPSMGFAPIVYQETPLTGVVLDFGPGDSSPAGEEVRAQDKKILLQAGGPVPKLEDKIMDGTTVYSIVGIGSVAPAGVPLVYTVHARK